ncbi:MAG: hypothetical protein HY869_02410 [Chloroflexi bacterium]|nr:hypothetical protein [Chloroflexota bacterium]
MPEQPALPRYTSENTGSSLKIIIPSRKNWFIIIFFGFWLMIWAVGEIALSLSFISAITDIVFGKKIFEGFFGSIFMLIILTIWTGFASVILYTWLWNITGNETIEVTDKSIQIAHRIFSFGKPKEYLVAHIKDLRAIPFIANEIWGFRIRFRFTWGVPPGTLSFDYGAKTVNFGSGCEEAEAKMILKEIWQAYPQYKPQEER